MNVSLVNSKVPQHLFGWIVLASGLSATLRLAAATTSDAAEQHKYTAPTFTKNVAPILFKNCVPCHRADGSAARVPLVSFTAVKLKA
ncbi:MAG TPA: hypothetical protein VII41_18195, partial [Steroidobacteraceae bacterium]